MSKISTITKTIINAFQLTTRRQIPLRKVVNECASKFVAKGEKVPTNVKLHTKPGISMTVNPHTINHPNPTFSIDGALVKANNPVHSAELGNVAVRLADDFASKVDGVQKEVSKIFQGRKVKIRPKSGASIESKLKRRIANGQILTSDNQAKFLVQDGIAGRIYLPKLSFKDVQTAINEFKYYGHNLNSYEKDILIRKFSGETLSRNERKIANKYARQIKNKLSEKQMKPYYIDLMSSVIKGQIERGVITLEKLEKSGLDPEVIANLRKNFKKIESTTLVDINNYSGSTGVSYFSNRQIKEFERLQILTGEKCEILSCPDFKRMSKKLTREEKEAIKESGYITGQITLKTKSGSYVEVQFRSIDFAELQHLEYDISLDKNTLSPICYEYRDAHKAMDKVTRHKYKKYMKDYFDYTRDIELGIKRPKPQLPEGCSEVLSIENLEKIHRMLEKEEKLSKEAFSPFLDLVPTIKIA